MIILDIHFYFKMMKSLMTLGLLCLLHLAVAQLSYVPSRMFASYQFLCVNVNNGNASLTASNNSNPYVLSLKDIHNNVQSSHIVLGGLSNIDPIDSSFTIQIVGSTTTQYAFALGIQGSSAYSKMQFFLLLIGTEAAGYIQALTFSEVCNKASPNASLSNPDTSFLRSVTTSVNDTFEVNFYLSYFTLIQTHNGTTFAVGVNDLGRNGSRIDFNYYVDAGNTLTDISIVVLIFCNDSMPSNVTTFGFQSGLYGADLNAANSMAPAANAYETGFNRKCVLGRSTVVFLASEYVEFDVNNVLPTIISNISNNPLLTMFCMIQLYNCSQINVHCLKCISHSMCSQCESEYYVQVYPNVSASCLICSGAITGCQICTNTSVCISCMAPTFLESGVICLQCSTFIPNCLNCTDNVTCIGCVDYYGLVDPATCSLCSDLIQGCQFCSSPFVCYKCYNGYYLNGSSCIKCNLGVTNCAVCQNDSYCVLCYSDSYLSSDFASCICNTGLIRITELCAVVGCSSAYRFNSTICLACNTSLNFYYSGGACNCMTGFVRSGQSCIIICGDGIVVSEACDDGNAVSGDGCSSHCTVEQSYDCRNGSLSSHSICVYVKDFSLELIEIKRTVNANRAEITLAVSSAVRPLNSMNFDNYLSILVNNKALSCSTSYSEGVITVLANYDTNIEGQQAYLQLAYDPNLFDLSPAVLSFKMVGYNQPLNVSDLTNLQPIILNLGYLIASLFLLQFIISFFFHKLIGLQTMQILQLIFFIRYLLGDSGEMPFYNLYSLRYINGYNVFMEYRNVNGLDGTMMRMGLGKNFIFNVMFQVALILVGWILVFCFGRSVGQLNLASPTALNIQRLRKATEKEYRSSMWVFILTVYSFFLFCFGVLSSVQQGKQNYYNLPRFMIIFALFILFYGIFYITGQMYLNWKSKYDEEQGLFFRYVTIFLFYHMLLGLLMVGLYDFAYGLQVMAFVQLIYLVLLILMRPYYIAYQNVLLIICQCVGVAFTAFLIAEKYCSFSQKMLCFIVIGFQGLLILVSMVGFVRLYLHSKLNEKAFKLMHIEEDKLNGKDIFSKREFKKQQEMLVKQIAAPNFAQRKEKKVKSEQDELTSIKMRLRGEYNKKIQEKQKQDETALQ